MRELIVVNACTILRDREVKAKIGPLRHQIQEHFIPVWRDHLVETDIKVRFAPMSEIPDLAGDTWPIFLNRHSDDEGALGWHDDDPSQNIRTYSRVFVGDCIRYGLDWGITLSHEALELILDPDIQRVWKMPKGRLAALEACDAVESDKFGYRVGKHKMSDFVLPAYFSADKAGPFDWRKKLKGPCPMLTEGGYMSITDAHGNWTEIYADRRDGMLGRRALMHGFRRQMRARIPADQARVASRSFLAS